MLFICGPTASGKSSTAIQIAKQINGEIVNGDAYQVYRGLETITAAPSQEELSQAPHHLFSVISPTQDFDAQQYLNLATPIITDIQARGKTPIIVGGSGMYLKFLTHGPSPVPPGDDSLRAKLETRTTESLVAELQSLDPEGAAITNLQNRRYVIRALEICLLSGQPMSAIKNEWKATCDENEKHLRGIYLKWEPETLRQRILERTELMLQNGAIDEIQSQPNLSITAQKAIGIPQIQAYLSREIDLPTCTEKIFHATSQYAKRQRTWFKKENWLTPFNLTDSSQIENEVKNFLASN